MAATTETANLYNLPLTALVVTDVKGIEDLSTLRGEDGYSPTVSLTSTTIDGRTGTLVTIQNKPGNYITSFIANGEKGDRGNDGLKGADGSRGSDGWTPVLSVNQDNGNYCLAYSYQQPKDKPASAEVTWQNGINGAPGAPGADGAPGTPGETPILSDVTYDPLSQTATIKYTYRQKNADDPPSGLINVPVLTGGGGGFDLSQVIDYFGKISLLKPVNEGAQPVFLSAMFYSDSGMSDKLFTIDTALTADQQLGYAYIGGNSEQEAWLPFSSTRFSNGFGPELDNYPIVIDIRSKLNADSVFDQFKEGKKIYVRYSWYWLDEKNEAHHSDNYSLVFPSTSEVGATSGARAIAATKRLNTIEDIDSDFEMYAAAPNIPNVIVPALSGDVDIVLTDFSAENVYTIKFKTKGPTTLTFYIGNVDKTWILYQKVNKNIQDAITKFVKEHSNSQFSAGKEYLITIELDMITRLVEN